VVPRRPCQASLSLPTKGKRKMSAAGRAAIAAAAAKARWAKVRAANAKAGK